MLGPATSKRTKISLIASSRSRSGTAGLRQSVVEGCTDADTHPKPPWRRRKEEYLSSLATKDHSTLLVSASDKLHNARSIVRDLRGIGDRVWGRFSVSKEETLWYYRSLVTAYRANPAHTPALVDELDRTVTEMETPAALADGASA